MINEIINRLEALEEHCLEMYDWHGQTIAIEAKEIVQEAAKDGGKDTNVPSNGWIPVETELPPMPKENPLFEYKPLELYLVTVKSEDYPFRAFWNGKFFTDGWGKVDVIAWQPLPAPYQKGE